MTTIHPTADTYAYTLVNATELPERERAKGIDISHYQEKYTPRPHHDFVIAKAVEITTENNKYKQHHDTVRGSGKVLGAYGYLRAGYDWRPQADALLEIAVAKNEADFLATDFEKRGNYPSRKFAEDNLDYNTYLSDQSGKRVLEYSSPSVIQEWMFQYGVYWVRDYDDLWIAQWPYYGWNDRMLEVPFPDKGWNPRLPAGCTRWRFWQYSADGNSRGSLEGVSSRDVDIDVFNGTVEELWDWCNLKPEPPPPTPEPCGCCCEALRKVWNIVNDVVHD